MKVWTNNRFQGVWPIPTAVVIVAETRERAKILLRRELKKREIFQADATRLKVKELLMDEEEVVILSDGDY